MKLFKSKNIIIKSLKGAINSLEEENLQLINKNKMYEHDIIILLDNAKELMARIKDLENNIEILTNNLSPKKKKEIGL